VGSEGFFQPNHRIDHGVLDFWPSRLVALLAPNGKGVSNPISALAIEPLPEKLAATIPPALRPDERG